MRSLLAYARGTVPTSRVLIEKDNNTIIVRSEVGALRGHCHIAPIAPGNVQVHWPEGNALIKRGVSDPECGVPDYNATVEIERID